MKSKLPEGWKEVELGEVIDRIENGNRPKGGVGSLKEGIPSIGGEHINKTGGFNFSNIKFISKEFYDSQKRGIIRVGDVLVVKDGATTGRVTFVSQDKFPYKKALVNEHVFILRPKSSLVTSQFLFYYLYGKDGQMKILDNFHGSAQGGINTQFVKNFTFLLPPLPTQQKIISILEKAEKAKEWRKEADELTKEFLKSVFVEMFGDPLKNTKKWPLRKFEEVIRLRRGFDLPVQDRAEGKYPLLASNGIIDSINEYKVIGPGIVTGRSGTIGKVNYVGENYWPLNTTLYSEDLHGNNPLYLLYFLQIYDLGRFVRGTGVPTLNRNLFHNEMIIYPPLPLQNKFASIIKGVEAMKEQQKQSKEQIDKLFNVLMQKAFKGELTV